MPYKNDRQSRQSVEQMLASSFESVRSNVTDRFHGAEESVRREPGKALLIAVFAGYVLRLLPIGAIIGAILSIAMTLLRPAILLLGAAKVYEFVQNNQAGERGSHMEESRIGG